MDLRVTSTGKTFYEVPSSIAAVLLEAFPASFERVQKAAPDLRQNTPPALPKTPMFSVGLNRAGVLTLFLTYPTGQIDMYIGKPENAARAFGKMVPPADLLQEYSRQWHAGHHMTGGHGV